MITYKGENRMEQFYLEVPSLKRKQEAIAFVQEFYEYHSEINGTGGLQRFLDNYEAWLDKLEEDYNRIPNEEKVPARTYFLVRESDSRILGMINIRLTLNERLKKFAGNIGYCIRPTERGKGYNKINLYLGLKICKKHGIKKALMDADKENPASWRTIESLGGIKIREYFDDENAHCIVRDYEIDVDKALVERQDEYEPLCLIEYTIYPEVYDAMVQRKKSVEIRLWNEKSKKIQIGDKIKFNVADSEEYLLVTVTNCYVFANVDELYQNQYIAKNCVMNNTKEECIHALYEIFEKENVQNSKLVGIEFKIDEEKPRFNKYNLLTAKKIAIFGWPATGKSTFSMALYKVTGIPVYPLDIIRWGNAANGQKDEQHFLKEYQEILEKEEWIIEGNALNWISARLEQADLLIFFESTVENCIQNFKAREERVAQHLEERIHFEETEKQSFEETIQWIKNIYAKKIDSLRLTLKEYTEKLLVIHNYEELEQLETYLASLTKE